MKDQLLTVALAQISPVWLDKRATIEKIKKSIIEGAQKKAELIVFGETLLPGYPFWVSLTDGAQFDNKIQKEIHAHYAQNAVVIERGDLDGICDLAKENSIAIYLGVIERPLDRGGHSLYASLVYINGDGEIKSVHRKLQPTYEERLTWAPGDGNGLRVHPLKAFTVGGLNCWENWMPLPRVALYGQGENLHVAVWPGSDYNTKDITRFIARESRSYVISVSSLMRKEDFPSTTPHLEEILKKAPDVLGNGGSCIAGPDGEWILEPVLHKEGLLIETLDFNRVLQERQNFDPVGHYSRPDVTQLNVNRERQSTVWFGEE
ncbi:carbon-nitrogen hydrolase family protein [Aquimarina sp. MMG015]|uniref:carbon-nitrogen hydrolase family protein n=1 Tax=unclassified Aquimarina TaxID=2627091 RepID=UPI000E47F0F8|nr:MULTISPECIES: carbon-nitrogen hydrolase family protein [unclassified Aquimarina]AXT56890.1 carbon-nitrogen hydrolase family protein [Aquimarina sp. AD1]MBQ4802899.1 carbon-nitrogen hydrolase family protein [Aquimarina sp. MMG015]RKN18409.1 carbon-nitrogen hydrolase family protein [Aquimarina sp. AD1]